VIPTTLVSVVVSACAALLIGASVLLSPYMRERLFAGMDDLRDDEVLTEQPLRRSDKEPHDPRTLFTTGPPLPSPATQLPPPCPPDHILTETGVYAPHTRKD